MKSMGWVAFTTATLMAILGLFSQCSSNASKHYNHTARCLYYWKSEFNLTQEQTDELKQSGVSRLFVKFFDVEWAEQFQRPVPVAPIYFASPPPSGINIVPVVYITNNTLIQLPHDQIPVLADSIYQKILDLLPNTSERPTEIQFDCDWTGSTKDKYFEFLKEFRKKTPPTETILSSTLRLHQVKYRTQSGIPPVERVTLMFYNMGNFKSIKTDNSILDLSTAKGYLSRLNEYPLPVDVALPLFSWGVVFRNGQFTNLIAQLRTTDAYSMPETLKPEGNNRYIALQSTMINGSNVGKGDLIRIEEISSQLCKQAAQLLSPKIPLTDTVQVILFHLDQELFQRYPNPEISEIYGAF